MKTLPTKYLVVLAVVGFGLAAVLCLRTARLTKQRALLTQNLEAATKKAAQVQKKYGEAMAEVDRAVGDSAAVQQSLAAEKAKLESEMGKLAEEKASLSKTGRSALEQKKRLEQEKRGLEEQKQDYASQIYSQLGKVESLQERYVTAKGKLAETTLKQLQAAEELEKLKASQKTVLEDLSRSQKQAAQAEANNAKLLALAQELLQKYKDKGFMSVFLQKEPITQVKKAEFEKLLQEYKEKVEQLKVANGAQASGARD